MKQNNSTKLLMIVLMFFSDYTCAGRLIEQKKYIDIKKKLCKFFQQYRTSTDDIVEAARAGRYCLVQDFLQQGGITFQEKKEALKEASAQGFLGIVKLLFQNGADLYCDHGQPLVKALNGQHQATYRFILQNGGNVKGLLGKRIDYIFRLACKIGDLQVADQLRTWGANINDVQNFTLRWSLVKNKQSSVRYLLEQGAQVTFLDKKLIIRCLPLFLGIEDKLKEDTKNCSKEQKNIVRSAVTEYCLRARLLEKWFTKELLFKECLRTRKRKNGSKKINLAIDPGLLCYILKFVG